eukprot:scaffold56627_cov28-Tisochrysis_lutea.AAC.2
MRAGEATRPARPTPAQIHAMRTDHARQKDAPTVTEHPSDAPPDGATIGLALKGGGNHALVAAIGVLRGFAAQELDDGCSPLDALDYISSNSGGGWANFPYMFAGFDGREPADRQHTSKMVLLDIRCEGGVPTPQPGPLEITTEDLSKLSSSGLSITLTYNPGWDVLCPAIASSCFGPLVRPHLIWRRYIYNSYFKPLGIPPGKYFTTCEAEAADIVKRHSLLEMRDFIWPRRGPLPIGHFAMVAPSSDFVRFTNKAISAGNFLWEHAVPTSGGFKGGFIGSDCGSGEVNMIKLIEDAREVGGDGITTVPFTGSPLAISTGYQWQNTSGDGYIMQPSSCCPPSKALVFPLRPSPPVSWLRRGLACWLGSSRRFSVESLAAASSMAMETSVGGLNGCEKLYLQDWLKSLALQFNADVTPRDAPDERMDWCKLEFGDGGIIDAHAILPLVQRRVKNIISVISPDPAGKYVPVREAELVEPIPGLTRYADIYNYACNGTEPADKLDRWILAFGPPFASLFGWMSMEPNTLRWASQPLNTVFKHGRVKLGQLMDKMNKLFLAGLPLIATIDLEVLDNPFWGTTPYCCHLTVICYYLPDRFGEMVGSSPLNNIKYVPGASDVPNSGRFSPPYEDVPELKIAGENTRDECVMFSGLKPYLNVAAYTPGQINLTVFLGTWMIDQAWRPLCVEGEVVFGGLKEMFAPKCKE